MTVRTRFAPSPTGYLHIGGARTALYSCLHAWHHHGNTVLRIEDTDLARSTPEAVAAIIEGLKWLGLPFDEGPFYQTQRLERYQAVIAKMLAEGTAYYCYCSKEELDEMRVQAEKNKQKPRYNGKWRPEAHKILPPIPEHIQPVVRFKQEQTGTTCFDDLVHGVIEFDHTELDDLIIARPDGTPTYNFCVVVDDMDMQITHVVRGDDHINNTPRQINILKALGAPIPQYAHVAMILGDDGQKLSKRHGAVSVTQYRDEGYLPEAVLNYLVRLGWSHGDQEIFSRDEMIRLFDLKDVNKAASAFNTSKLRWLNQQYMMSMPPQKLAECVRLYLPSWINPDPNHLNDAVAAHVARCHTLVELADMLMYLYQDPLVYDPNAKIQHLTLANLATFQSLVTHFQALSKWETDALQHCIKTVMQSLQLKMPQIGMPLRTAVVGRTSSPNLDITLSLLGREKVLQRLNQAIHMIETM